MDIKLYEVLVKNNFIIKEICINILNNNMSLNIIFDDLDEFKNYIKSIPIELEKYIKQNIIGFHPNAKYQLKFILGTNDIKEFPEQVNYVIIKIYNPSDNIYFLNNLPKKLQHLYIDTINSFELTNLPTGLISLDLCCNKRFNLDYLPE